MKAMRIAPLSEAHRGELDRLYRTTKDPRLRTRAQLVLLAGEQGRTVPEIATIVRETENTILRWLKRYQAEGIEGLKDAPRSGRPVQVTAAFQAQLVAAVRRRPRSLELPYSLLSRPQHQVSSPDPDYQVKKDGRRRTKWPKTGRRVLLG